LALRSRVSLTGVAWAAYACAYLAVVNDGLVGLRRALAMALDGGGVAAAVRGSYADRLVVTGAGGTVCMLVSGVRWVAAPCGCLLALCAAALLLLIPVVRFSPAAICWQVSGTVSR